MIAGETAMPSSSGGGLDGGYDTTSQMEVTDIGAALHDFGICLGGLSYARPVYVSFDCKLV
jgi:hypothetical protein